MQIFALALIVGLFVHDASAADAAGAAGAWTLTILGLTKLVLVAGYALACRRTLARTTANRADPRAVRRLDRWTGLWRLAVIALFGLDLYLGVLRFWRQTIGDWVLIDELLVLAPTVALLLLEWTFYYPIERTLRSAALLRRLDEGRPLPPLVPRAGYVLHQTRMMFGLLLAPMLVVVGWIETVNFTAAASGLQEHQAALACSHLLGAATIVLLAPPMVCRMLDTEPLPDGDLRNRLESLCREAGVSVRGLRVWRTQQTMTNAAVLGFFPRLRYILLTDAMLEQARQTEVEAVMAHEIGHVRQRHFFWLASLAVVLAALLEVGWRQTTPWIHARVDARLPPVLHLAGATGDLTKLAETLSLGLLLLAGLVWLAAFGWISRRFERQADTFAVRHFCTSDHVDEQASQRMQAALQTVAELNQMAPEKRSWRHGSIAWRQDHLRRIVGRPLDALPNDRVLQRLKALAVLAAVGLTLGQVAALWR